MKEPNPKLVGIFVIGGLVLFVGALILFSSQDLFTPKRNFVAYFKQSLNGLNVGAAVRFRGIPVGEVINIDGVYEPDTGNMTPRIIIEFHPETLENAVVQEGEYTLFPLLLKNGLRATLKSQSLLTGQLYVALDFHPETPQRLLGKGTDKFPEMPTIDSGLDEAIARLSELPIEEVLLRASSALEAAESLIRNPDIEKTLAALPQLLADADQTVVEIRKLAEDDAGRLISDARETLVSARVAIDSISDRLNRQTLSQVESTLAAAEHTLVRLQGRLSQDDPLTHELLTLLREAASAARSVRDLATDLERNPESLIRGKSSP